MDPVSITCPNCSASLKISKPELIGATINCPKCKTPFVAAREEAFDLEPPDLAYGFVNDEPELPPAPLLRPAAPRQPAQPDTRKQPSQRKSKGPEEPAKGKKRTGKKRKKTKPSVPLGERLQKWWPAIVLILLIATAGVYFGNGFLLSLAVKRAVRDGRLDGAVTIRSWADLKRNSNVLRPVAEPTASGSPAQPAQGGSPPPAQSNETPQPQAPNEPNPEPTPAAPIVSGVAPGSNAPAPPGDAAALPPATPAEMPKLPNRRFDLSYLPPKPELVASVRVGELWNTPAVKGLLGSLGPGAQQVVDDWSGRLGVSLEDVESVVVGATGLADTISKGMPFAAAPPADPADDAKAESKTTTEDNFVVVVRTVNPYDPEKVLEAFPHKDPIQHAGSSYYVSDGAGDMATPPCVHFADPKTIVVASEPAIQAAISRGRRRPGVPQMLQSFNASYHLVVAVVAYDTDLFGTVAGLAPETGAKGLSSAIAQHASAIGLSLHAGDGLTAEMTVRCKNPNGAADVARAADEAVAQMREQASAVDPAAPGAMGSVPLEVMNTVSMRQAGPSVTMTAAVPPSVFEPQNLQIAMAPLNPLAAMLAGGFFATGGTPTGSALEAADPEAIGPDGPFAAVDDDEPIVPRQPRTGPPRIVVDATKGGFSWWYPQRGPQFDPAADHKGKALVDYFQQRGWAVRELAEGDDVVAALGESDVAIRFGDTAPHTPQEVRAYDRFVQSGGALLLLAGHRPEEREDPLAAAFGVRFGGQIAGGSIQEWDRRHPVTRRLDPVFFTFASEVTEWPESATILGWTGERSDQGVILGTLEHGGGTVVFLSCDSLLARVPQPLTDRVFALLSGDLKAEGVAQSGTALVAKRIDADFEPEASLSHNAWASAKPVRVERRSEDGETNSELATTVRALWSDRYLYLAFEAPFTELTIADRANTARESRGLAKRDIVEALISGPGRQVSTYRDFQVAPNGEWADFNVEDAGETTNVGWNSGFDKVARVDQDNKKWSVLMRIPLSEIDSDPPETGTRWRINLFRIDIANDALLAWNPTRSVEIHDPRRFGALVFQE